MGTEVAEADEIATVRRMLDAWNRTDFDEVAGLFAVDGIFHSVMRQPISGREAIRRHLGTLQSAKPGNEVHIEIRHIGVIDGLVFAERLDRVVINGKSGQIPAVGIFEVRNGEVAHWREYYDRETLLRETGQLPKQG
jgi:limonene-1,2-epoxide hydrolase